jgi:uncharacterized protein (DUF1684 family)
VPSRHLFLPRVLPHTLAGTLLFLACAPSDQEPDPSYLAEIEAWHREREESLRREDGWLTLVGLHWLEEGENSFGSDSDNRLVFPDGKMAAHAGVFVLEGGTVSVEVAPEAQITHQGQPVGSMILEGDGAGEPSVLRSDTLMFYVIQRGERVGIRVKDSEHPNRKAFTGMERYPIDPGWRLQARFEPYEPPKRIKVPNILGTVADETCHGALVFQRGGKSYRLDPLGEPGKELFVIFGDETNGYDTYGGGRFLYTDPPGPDGRVIVDFNKAYNPPCVFTPYATCPLPPPQNRLPRRVEAGEKNYGTGHAAG